MSGKKRTESFPKIKQISISITLKISQKVVLKRVSNNNSKIKTILNLVKDKRLMINSKPTRMNEINSFL